MHRAMDGFDLLLTPTLPVTAFLVGTPRPPVIAGVPQVGSEWAALSYRFNMTGWPAATVPCPQWVNGLPVGLQIVGRARDDLTVLRAAAAFETAHPWRHRRPLL